jgi:hypothetical protein
MGTGLPDGATAVNEDPFGALARELTDFDYVASDIVDGIVTYAHAQGGAILATIDHTGQEARLARRNSDGETIWAVRFNAATPESVQLIVLCTVLSAHLGDENAILRRVASLLRLPRAPM